MMAMATHNGRCPHSHSMFFEIDEIHWLACWVCPRESLWQKNWHVCIAFGRAFHSHPEIFTKTKCGVKNARLLQFPSRKARLGLRRLVRRLRHRRVDLKHTCSREEPPLQLLEPRLLAASAFITGGSASFSRSSRTPLWKRVCHPWTRHRGRPSSGCRGC